MKPPVRIGLSMALVAALGFLIAFYAAVNRASVDPVEIAARCATAKPVWQNYQEDVKGQVGASATATWRGRPVRLETEGNTARLTMHVEPPWSDYDAAMPILLRDPLGHTVQNDPTATGRVERVYTFQLPGVAGAPWVEIHYPHQERRLPLTSGQWQAN